MAALAATAWSDWRRGKIYNRLVAAVVVVALAWQLSLAAAAALGWTQASPRLGLLLLNASIGLAVAVGMWIEQVWAAGDAKVFAATLLLVPLRAYGAEPLPWFPAMAWLVNIFVVLFAVLVGEWALASARRIRNGPAAFARTAREVRARAADLALAALAFLFSLLLVRVLRREARLELLGGLELAPSALLLVLFVGVHWVVRIMRHRWVAAAVLALTALALAHEAWTTGRVAGWRNLITLNLAGVALLMVRFLYVLQVRSREEMLVDASALRPHMLLSWRQEKRQREDQRFNEKKLGPVGIEGISAEQVAMLQEVFGPAGLNEPVGIARTLPLGPILLAGLVLTLLADGNAVRGWLILAG